MKYEVPDTTPKQEQSNLGSGTRPGENADASKIRKEPKVYAHGGVSYDPRRDDPMEQPEGDPTPSSSAVPKHMQQRQDPRLLNKRRCPDLQVPAKAKATEWLEKESKHPILTIPKPQEMAANRHRPRSTQAQATGQRQEGGTKGPG